MESLSEFIQKKRESAGLSITGLAKKTNLDTEFLEDIEAGKELMLSVTQRQQLARALKCSPKEIKSREKDFKFEAADDEVIEDLKSKILRHETNLKCPFCGEPLITRVAKSYDLEDNLILSPKAHCVKCVFQIK